MPSWFALGPANTLDPAKERRRSLDWLDWAIRVYLPTWLDLVPALRQRASVLRALPPVTDSTACDVGLLTRAAEREAREATWGGYRAPSLWRAADRALMSTTTPAGPAAQVAAAAEARAASLDATLCAARVAAHKVAREAAAEASRAATRRTRLPCTQDAVEEYAREGLAPTVKALQGSAAVLLLRHHGFLPPV